MRVRFADSVIADPASFDSLDGIIHTILEGRHIWVIDDADSLLASAWIQADQGRSTRRGVEALTKSVTAAAYPQTTNLHSIAITVATDGTDGQFVLQPGDAVRALRAPMHILVENQESDGAFLVTMIKAFDRVDLLLALEEGWADIRQLGGFGEVAKAIEQLRALTVGPMRMIVLADSDRSYPGEITPTIQKVESSCTAVGVPYVILRKRKIENYIPIDYLPHGPTRAALLQLAEEQRDHYEMKRGFKRGEYGQTEVPDSQKKLYERVRPSVLTNLCGGFGRNLAEIFKLKQDDITADAIALMCTGDPNEIPRLLNTIESLL